MLRSLTVEYDMFMTCPKYFKNIRQDPASLCKQAVSPLYVTPACHNREPFMTRFVTGLSYFFFTLLQSFSP
jgi:hypothetical protein